jgi:hypothetical protein
MDFTRFAVRLHSALPVLTGIPQLGDDRLCVRVGHPEALAFVRILPPSYGLVMEAIELGLLEPLSLQRPVGEVLSLLASAEGGHPHGLLPAPPLPHQSSRQRSRHLYRLK